MLDIERLKQELKPTLVVQYYLGEPIKSNHLGIWYKSPFRQEKTASFLINDTKGIHDFGTSKHYDIVSFLQELFVIDFKTAINKLAHDFGIIDYNTSSCELNAYLIKKRQEEIEIKKNLDVWFRKTYSNICDLLQIWQKIKPTLVKFEDWDGLRIAYENENKLELLAEIFIDATEEDKYKLYKQRKEIEKCLKY